MTARPDLSAYKSATGYRWVNSDGHDVSSDTVLFAVCADLKMLRDHQRTLRVVVSALVLMALSNVGCIITLASLVRP